MAEFADLIFDGNHFPVEGQAAESGTLEPVFRQDQGAPQGACQMAEFGHEDGFFQPVLEGGHERPVPRRRALKTDLLSDVRLHGHLGQIVFTDRMEDAGQDFVGRIPFGEIVVDVPFHENRAAVAGDGGRRVHGAVRIFGKGTPSLSACSSMKLPVPAAQTLFMTEEVTMPFFMVVNFASWPPISMIVSVSGFSS